MKLRQLAVLIFCLACLVEQGFTARIPYDDDNFGDEYHQYKLRIRKASARNCNCRNRRRPEVTFYRIGDHIINNGESSRTVGIGENEEDLLYRILANAYDFKKEQQSEICADEHDAIKLMKADELVRYILSNGQMTPSLSQLLETKQTQQQSTTQPPETTSQDTQPPVTTTQPPATTTQPPETTTQPPETTTQPPITTTQPAETTTQPPITTTQPPITTTQPSETTTQPPETTTQPPITTAQPPITTTQPPETTTQPPETTT